MSQLIAKQLADLLPKIVISPALIDTLLATEPSAKWLEPIATLEQAIVSIRTSARVTSRQSLDDAVELLKSHVSVTAPTSYLPAESSTSQVTLTLRTFFIKLLTPYRTSLVPNLSILQNIILTRYRPLFAFLQRHSPRAAHEVQKAYVSTAQWYYETGFRRYVRSLERIRLRSVTKSDPIGYISSTGDAKRGECRGNKTRTWSDNAHRRHLSHWK